MERRTVYSFQHDNLKTQNEDKGNIKKFIISNDDFIYNPSPNCIKCETLIDHTFGRKLITEIADFERTQKG